MPGALKATVIEGGGGIPDEPDWSQIYSDVLDIASAHEEWGIVVREMQSAHTITVANGHAIGRLVSFRLLYRTALQQIAERGAILKKSRGERYNPHWNVIHRAADACSALEAELGISPIRRARAAKAQKRTTADRASDAYLRRTG
jgi:P27 family predicted phage terminase small subunit